MEEDTLYTSRLFNHVIYVLMDLVIITSAGESEENIIYHDTLLQIRNNPGQIDEIADWVLKNKDYLPRPLTEGMSDELYEMIVDGILLIYMIYYDKLTINLNESIKEYQNKYNTWKENKIRILN